MVIGFEDRWMSHFLGNFAGAKGEPIAALDSTPNFRKIAKFEDGLGKPTGGGHRRPPMNSANASMAPKTSSRPGRDGNKRFSPEIQTNG